MKVAAAKHSVRKTDTVRRQCGVSCATVYRTKKMNKHVMNEDGVRNYLEFKTSEVKDGPILRLHFLLRLHIGLPLCLDIQ